MPFGLLLDKYRWEVFQGKITAVCFGSVCLLGSKCLILFSQLLFACSVSCGLRLSGQPQCWILGHEVSAVFDFCTFLLLFASLFVCLISVCLFRGFYQGVKPPVTRSETQFDAGPAVIAILFSG